MALDGQIAIGIVGLFAMFIVALLPIQLIHRRLGHLRTRQTQSDVEIGFHTRQLPFYTPWNTLSVSNHPSPSVFQLSREDSATTSWMPCRPSPVFAPLRNAPSLR